MKKNIKTNILLIKKKWIDFLIQIKKLSKRNKIFILSIFIISIFLWFFIVQNNIINNKIEKEFLFNWKDWSNAIYDKNWKRMSNETLLTLIKYKKPKNIPEKELKKINKEIWYDYLKDKVIITYYIYDKENIDITKEFEKNNLWSNEKLIKIDKNSSLGKKLLLNSPYKYNMFPLLIFDNRDKKIKNIKIPKEEKMEKWDHFYVSEKYQIFANLFYLSNSINTDILNYCSKDWLIISNVDTKDYLLFIWKESLNDFFENIKDLYSIDKNICFINNTNKYINYINGKNKELTLRLLYDWNYHLLKPIHKKNNLVEKSLIRYFNMKDWVYFFENLKVSKIENLKTIIK